MTSQNNEQFHNSEKDEKQVDVLPTAQSISIGDSSFFRPSILTPFAKPDVSNSNGVEQVSNKTAVSNTHLVPATKKSTESGESNSGLSPKNIFHPPSGPATVNQSTLSGYVFGANISSRVTNAHFSSGASSNLWSKAVDKNTGSSSDSAATVEEVVSSDSVFTTLAKAIVQPKACGNTPTGSIDSAAFRLEQANKQASVNLKHVQVITGEEDETLVFRSHCRAHVFDSVKQKWNAIGAAEFHLNDTPLLKTSSCRSEKGGSRVVVRLAATGRLIVNSLVWKDMPVALVDGRSLRLAAVHENNDEAEGVCKSLIKNYLFIFPADASIDRLFSQLTDRKKLAEENTITSSPVIEVGKKRSLPESTKAAANSKVVRCDNVEVNAAKDCPSKPVGSRESPCASTEAMTTPTQVESPPTEGEKKYESHGDFNRSEGDSSLPSDDSMHSKSLNSSTALSS